MTTKCPGGMMKPYMSPQFFACVIRRVSRADCRSACAMLIAISSWSGIYGQSASSNRSAEPQEPNPKIERAADGVGYTLHVTTREVVVEIVARDNKNQPVDDLSQDEFQVFEDGMKNKEGMLPVSAFKKIDPDSEPSSIETPSSSLVLPLGGRCEIRSTVHYEVAFHPLRWTSGYHTVRITTTRRHITLSYRSQFYVGLTDVDEQKPRKSSEDTDSILRAAACYHPGVPASLSLSATKTESKGSSQLDYSVTVLPASLGLAGITEGSHSVDLEYGVCTFSRSGHVLGYWHFSEDRRLTAEELTRADGDGWREMVEVPRQGNPALARFVVLEPRTGNLGTIDLSTNSHILPDAPEEIAATNGTDPNSQTHVLVAPTVSDPGETGHRRTLGSPIPKAHSLCGDVYELSADTTLLPKDFQKLNAVGAVYTSLLDVPEQILSQGLPGATTRAEWFGIDYYGEFWITKPGKYQFVLNADDGADLYIDGRMLINNDGIHPPTKEEASVTLDVGRHTIHMPYFQGPTYVNLILKVRPPDESVRIFNLGHFLPPSSPEHVYKLLRRRPQP